jgi:hypothetical protein
MLGENDYEIETLPGGVKINFGAIPGFTVPSATAVKMALLLLKKAGCSVKLSSGQALVQFPIDPIKAEPHELPH